MKSRSIDRPICVLIAPSGLKEALSASEATEALAAGVARAMPSARILRSPMIDGGEGFTDSLVARTGGTIHPVRVTGPLGHPIDACFGMLGGALSTTATIETAAAAGLGLIPTDKRDPTRTTTFGVGELILAALDHGADEILIGCGDSGVNDAGAGLAQGLGVRLLDATGKDIGFGGGALVEIARIDLSRRDERVSRVRVRAAVNWQNVLLGENGVTRVYAAQKGATPQQVIELEAAISHFANQIEITTGADVRHAPGTGASGGLGASLVAFAGATLHPRFDLLLGYTDFEKHLAEADIVLTAEGEIDGRSVLGKVPGEVGRRAAACGIPVIALAGAIGHGGDVVLEHGIDAFASIADRCYTREESIRNSAILLERAAESTMRMVAAGMRIRSPAASRRRPGPKLKGARSPAAAGEPLPPA